MILNRQLREDAELLLRANDYDALRSWFAQWKNEDELVDKVLIFGQLMMPHYFRDPSPIFHRDIIRAFFSRVNEYRAAPRGFSKTTVLQCCILFSCAIQYDHFIAVIEKTFTEAAEVIAAVREECVDNRLLIATFGDMLGGDSASFTAAAAKTKDAEGDVFINKVRIRAKGFDQPIRGLKSRQWRPTRIVCDDIEQDQHINSKEQRHKYRDNYDKGIQPSVDIDGSIKVFGTILHEASLLNSLIKQHGGKVFRAYYVPTDAEWDESAAYTRTVLVNEKPVKLLWPSRWTWEKLMQKKKDMAAENKSANAFEQEYRNNPLAEEQRVFKWEWLHNPLRTIELDELLKKGKMLAGYAALDFADSKNEGRDFTGGIVHLIDAEGNRYRVGVYRRRLNSPEKIALIFEIWETFSKYGLVKIGVEKKAFADEVVPQLDAEKRKRQVYPVVEELKPMGRNKQARIEGALVGLYSQAKVWTVTIGGVPVGDTADHLTDLYDYPKAAHDDTPDAEAYISDIAVVPLEDERRADVQRDPSDDPWARDTVTVSRPDYDEPAQQQVYDHDEDPY